MATYIRDGESDSQFAAAKPTNAGTLIRGNEWGIDNELSGFIVQSEDIAEEVISDTTQDQKGAVVSQLDYDQHWTLTLGVIGDTNATLPEVGDIAFRYGGHTWKVLSVTYTGAFNDKKKWSITAERYRLFPTQLNG